MYRLLLKPLLDRMFALLLLLLLWPLMLLIAALIRIQMGSPILFTQTRPGLHGALFRIYKFRTMSNETDASGAPLSDAERLRGIGKTIRSLSLDELPQLFNVLRGEMSFVGPRPLLPEYLPLYTPEQARRHEVRPGITGWAQVNGRNAISWEQKFAYDVWYVEHQSFWLDLKIAWLTVRKVLGRDGVSAQGHVSMEKFQGSPKS
ncbi:MAG: sugar transferase [Campylobacterales bacterium]|nr:sugar transferase [Campylobacterales bacterium]